MSSSSNSSGIGLGSVLLVIFIILKLIGVITWSWWWVLCPLWLSLLVAGVVLAVLATVAILMALLD